MKTELIKRIVTSILLLILLFFFVFNGSIIFLIFCILIFLQSVYEWHNLSINKISFILGTFFLLLSVFSAFILMNENIVLFLFVILISVFTDIGGFVFGKFFKGPKLTKISPNKTYSGVIGGLFLSHITGIYYVIFNKQFFELDTFMNYLNVSIIILLISLISQIGDLIISYFKRYKNIKNTGSILPGHGGLLDRIDGIIFTIPSFHIINVII